jgi:hypothetical protein
VPAALITVRAICPLGKRIVEDSCARSPAQAFGCRFVGTPRGLGLASATTSAAFKAV